MFPLLDTQNSSRQASHPQRALDVLAIRILSGNVQLLADPVDNQALDVDCPMCNLPNCTVKLIAFFGVVHAVTATMHVKTPPVFQNRLRPGG
jgi:hypothetical protein